MPNKMLNIVAVSEDGQLAVAKDRKSLCLEYSENTMGILKQYLEQVYQQNFEVTEYFKVSINVIYNISNHIRESFYFNPTYSVFSAIEIQDDYFISLAKLFNLVNELLRYMINNALDNVYFYVGDSIER